MKKLMYWMSAAQLLLSVASCSVIRHRVNREEQDHFRYAKMASASDSLFRSWYIYADSGFTFHPDSGLRTLSGRLLGWEVRVNHETERQTLDSARAAVFRESEAVRDNRGLWTELRMGVIVALAVVATGFVVRFFNKR